MPYELFTERPQQSLKTNWTLSLIFSRFLFHFRSCSHNSWIKRIVRCVWRKSGNIHSVLRDELFTAKPNGKSFFHARQFHSLSNCGQLFIASAFFIFLRMSLCCCIRSLQLNCFCNAPQGYFAGLNHFSDFSYEDSRISFVSACFSLRSGKYWTVVVSTCFLHWSAANLWLTKIVQFEIIKIGSSRNIYRLQFNANTSLLLA